MRVLLGNVLSIDSLRLPVCFFVSSLVFSSRPLYSIYLSRYFLLGVVLYSIFPLSFALVLQ